jgi:hypothetical protein
MDGVTWLRSGSGPTGLGSNFDDAQQRTNLSVADMAFNEFRTSAKRATHLAGPLSHPF